MSKPPLRARSFHTPQPKVSTMRTLPVILLPIAFFCACASSPTPESSTQASESMRDGGKVSIEDAQAAPTTPDAALDEGSYLRFSGTIAGAAVTLDCNLDDVNFAADFISADCSNPDAPSSPLLFGTLGPSVEVVLGAGWSRPQVVANLCQIQGRTDILLANGTLSPGDFLVTTDKKDKRYCTQGMTLEMKTSTNSDPILGAFSVDFGPEWRGTGTFAFRREE